MQIGHGGYVARSRLGIAALGNWIHIAGGELHDMQYTGDMLRINVCDGRMVKLASMSHEMEHVSCALAP